MSGTMFSVIFYLDNCASKSNGALDSLVSQTYGDFEAIIVDDMSSDGTEAIVRERYHDHLESGQFTYIYMEHKCGVSLCRNIGIENSSGDWICYLDSDNVVKSDYLETFSRAIAEHPDVLCFYAQLEYKNSKLCGKAHDYDPQELRKLNYIDLGIFVHSRAVYEKCGGFNTDLRRLVDWELLLRYSESYDFKYIPKVVMVYNDDPSPDRITRSESLSVATGKVAQLHKLDLDSVSTIALSSGDPAKDLRALSSAVSQDGYIDHRICFFVGPDSPPDGILEQFIDNNPNVSVIPVENIGNLSLGDCIDGLNSKFIAFLDCLDVWINKRKLHSQIQFLNEHKGCRVCYTDHYIMENGVASSPSIKTSKTMLDLEDQICFGMDPAFSVSTIVFLSGRLSRKVLDLKLSSVSLTVGIGIKGLGHLSGKYCECGPRVVPPSDLAYMCIQYSGFLEKKQVFDTIRSSRDRQKMFDYFSDRYFSDEEFRKYLCIRTGEHDFESYIESNYPGLSFVSNIGHCPLSIKSYLDVENNENNVIQSEFNHDLSNDNY